LLRPEGEIGIADQIRALSSPLSTNMES